MPLPPAQFIQISEIAQEPFHSKIYTFPPAVIAARSGSGALSFRAPHRLQSAGALGRAGWDWDGRVEGPRPDAAAPGAARVLSKRSGPPCAPAVLHSNYGCHCQTPGV